MRARPGLGGTVAAPAERDRIVEDFVQAGLVSLYTYSGDADATIIDIPNDEAPAIIADSANWAPGRERLICLAPTDKGRALYRGGS